MEQLKDLSIAVTLWLQICRNFIKHGYMQEYLITYFEGMGRNGYTRMILSGHTFLTTRFIRFDRKHDDGIAWKLFLHHCPFVGESCGYPVTCGPDPSECGTLMFPLLLAWTNCWPNNQVSGDLKSHDAHDMFIGRIRTLGPVSNFFFIAI